MIAGGARMVLVNGMGSVGGPIVGGAAVGVVAPDALFVVMAVAYVVIGSYALFRMTRREAPSSEERASFTPTAVGVGPTVGIGDADVADLFPVTRSEEHTSELQSLMRLSYAVFCLKQKTHKHKAT